METIKELNDEVGEAILFYIVEHNIEDPRAIEILLKHVYKNSREFVEDYLENILIIEA